MKIMIVDDSKAMRMIVMRTLRQAGYDGHELLQAEHGADALAQITGAGGVDLILSDWNMPEMNGIDFLRALRAAGDETTFGFVTSEGTTSMRDLAAQAGAAFLVAKPFTVEAFQAALSAVGV